MSNYLALATVTSALRQLILKGLQSAPWGLSHDYRVTVSPPDAARPKELAERDQINLFLYEVIPSAAWRNQPPPQQVKSGEAGVPPLALDLRYLITAYAPDNDGIEAHRLLGRTLSVLHDHPVLGAAELEAAMAHSDVHRQVERIRLSPHPIAVEEMSKLWSMFQKPYNLSVAWQASVVLIESTRAARAPLPVLSRGPADAGAVVQPELGPITPGLVALAPPAQQTSVRLGEALRIEGHLLAGEQVRAAVTHSRWTAPRYLTPEAVTSRSVSVTLPSGSQAEAEWPAGVYTLSLGITRRSGDAELFTNELPFTLAPTITSVSPPSGSLNANGALPLSVTVTPQLRPEQRVSLIVGDRDFRASALTTPAYTAQFVLEGLSPARYRLRLRVDGVDSIIIDRTATPPVFVGPELEVT